MSGISDTLEMIKEAYKEDIRETEVSEETSKSPPKKRKEDVPSPQQCNDII